MRYDLLVIGNSPAGHQGALAAASLQKHVAIVHAPRSCGPDFDLVGNSTLPFEQLHDALFDVPELLQGLRKNGRRPAGKVCLESVRSQLTHLIERDRKNSREQLRRHHVSTFAGEVRFQNAHEVSVKQNGGVTHVVEADRILIASETRPIRPDGFPFDGQRIFDANDILRLEQLPQTVHVIGGGVTGLRCAVLLAKLGTRVTVVDGRADLRDSFTTEPLQGLWEDACALNVEFQLGEDVLHVARRGATRVSLTLESGTQLMGEAALVTIGNQGATANLQLERAGVRCDERGRIWCNTHQQTWTPHIYAAGDIVGFPIPKGVTADSGLQAVCHAWEVAKPTAALAFYRSTASAC